MMNANDTERPSVWRRKLMWVPLLIGALLGLIGGAALSLTAHPGYESTGTAFVVFSFPPEEPDPFSGSQFVRQRIESYAQLGQSPEVLQAVADDVGGFTGAELADHVTVSAVPGTVLLRVTVRDSDQVTSVKIANSVMSNLDDAVVAVESGGSGAVSPIGLVRVQPAISGPASTTFGDVVKPLGGVAVGTLLGAAFGWALARRTPRGSGPTSPPRASPGKHRERSPDGMEPQRLPQLQLSLRADARPKQPMNAL